MNQNTIIRYETGEREPGINELIKLADYFNISIDYLVERSAFSRFESFLSYGKTKTHCLCSAFFVLEEPNGLDALCFKLNFALSCKAKLLLRNS